MVVEGSVTASAFIEFMKRILVGTKRKMFLIVDGHPTHRSKLAKEFIATQKGKIELFFLPPYSPELNPDELVWNNVKNGIVGQSAIKDKQELKSKVVFTLLTVSNATLMPEEGYQEVFRLEGEVAAAWARPGSTLGPGRPASGTPELARLPTPLD